MVSLSSSEISSVTVTASESGFIVSNPSQYITLSPFFTSSTALLLSVTYSFTTFVSFPSSSYDATIATPDVPFPTTALPPDTVIAESAAEALTDITNKPVSTAITAITFL